MDSHLEIPSFDVLFADLDQFILDLIREYKAKKIKSWDDLEERVNAFFAHVRIEQVESFVPGWKKMASYADGLTLIHVMCVFLGLYMLPEFQSMTIKQQEMMKWVILFHDVKKELQVGKRDHAHAFRSAVGAAQALSKLGFSTTPEYDLLIAEWSQFTWEAVMLIKTRPITYMAIANYQRS